MRACTRARSAPRRDFGAPLTPTHGEAAGKRSGTSSMASASSRRGCGGSFGGITRRDQLPQRCSVCRERARGRHDTKTQLTGAAGTAFTAYSAVAAEEELQKQRAAAKAAKAEAEAQAKAKAAKAEQERARAAAEAKAAAAAAAAEQVAAAAAQARRQRETEQQRQQQEQSQKEQQEQQERAAREDADRKGLKYPLQKHTGRLVRDRAGCAAACVRRCVVRWR